MRTPGFRDNSKLALTLLTLLFSLSVAPAQADQPENIVVQQQSIGQLPGPASILQVTGTTNQFTISASHADILSVLTLLFAQSHRQFVPDAGVRGEVTLRLNDQTFNTVLNAVCQQTFLRYEMDADGIYRFKQNTEALRETILRMRGMDAFLADQLRRMGYTVTSSSQNGGGQAMGRRGYAGPNATVPTHDGVPPQPVPGAIGAKGDAGPAGAAGTLPNGSVLPQRSVGSVSAKINSTDAPAVQQPKTTAKSVQSDSANVQRGLGGNTPQAVTGSNGSVSKGNSAVQNRAFLGVPEKTGGLSPDPAFDQLMRDSGLVGVHTNGQQVPIKDVLDQFSRQANVPILLDPEIPTGYLFRTNINLVRPLQEALNLLAVPAHLEWRYVGDKILVSTSPDFKIFYGASNIPKVVFPGPLRQQSPPAAPAGTGGSAGQQKDK